MSARFAHSPRSISLGLCSRRKPSARFTRRGLIHQVLPMNSLVIFASLTRRGQFRWGCVPDENPRHVCFAHTPRSILLGWVPTKTLSSFHSPRWRNGNAHAWNRSTCLKACACKGSGVRISSSAHFLYSFHSQRTCTKKWYYLHFLCSRCSQRTCTKKKDFVVSFTF